MSDVQQEHEAGRGATSGIVKMFLGKVFHRSVFSDQALLFIFLAVVFLLPIFFVPGGLFAPEFAKMILLEASVLVATFMWAAGRLRDGHVQIPKSLLLLVSTLLVVQFVVAAFMSPAPLLSFIGSGYDLGTVNSFVVLFLFMFLGSMVFSSRDRILMLYSSLMLSSFLVMLYQIARQFFGADFLSFDIFTSPISTTVGRWNDLAALMGGVAILVLATRYFFPGNKLFRIPALVVFLGALYFLLSINFTALWLILAVLTGMLIALSIYEGERDYRKKAREAREGGAHHAHKPLYKRFPSHLPPVVIILFLIALFYGSGLANVPWGKNTTTVASIVNKSLRAPDYSEVVLTPQFTYDIVKNTLIESPFFGTGPNRFSSAYLKHKMSVVNLTPFWDATFDFGLGRIPTYFGTTGIIGTVLWFLFVVLLFVKARKVFALFAKDRVAAYLGFSLFLLSLYFWSLSVFYLPNITIFAFAFLFTGALIAFLVGEGVLGSYRASFGDGSRLSVVLTPVLIVVLVGVVASGVLLHRQTSSIVAFNTAQAAAVANNLTDAEKNLTLANSLSERDVYQRALSSLAMAKLQALTQEKDLSQEDVLVQARGFIDDARVHAERAIALDPTNFENYLQYGNVFDALATLGVQNTAEFARDNYEQALLLNPKSPRVLFMLAHIEFILGDRAKTKDYLARALAERPNLLEALSFFVQLEIQDNNPASAIAAIEAGVRTEPTSFPLRFALGYMYFLGNDNLRAGAEFEAAVLLNPSYADAKYFLALVYARLGHSPEAIQQLTDVQTLNPDNKELPVMIKNLKASKDPFAGLPLPAPGATTILPGVKTPSKK